MNNLKDFKSEINKCSKCGLCQSVCPVYKITGNDCAVSRGKFVMLDGVLKGDLKLSKTINKYLDMCLKCGKCKDFCPSGIDVCKIFETAKYEYAKNTLLGKFIFFLESKWVFGNILKILSLIRPFTPSSSGTGEKLKLLYFRGCANYILPYTDKLLKKLPNIEIIEKDFDCCGLPFLSSGNLERYEEVKAHNLKQIENIDFDYIFTDCASCESTLKEYFPSHVKFINLGELLVKLGLKFKSKKPLKVTFHKPCHLGNIDFLKPLFDNCENTEYIEMPEFDDCCGFAGEFAVKNKKLSSTLSRKKAQNIILTKADYVTTTCPACLLGLKQGLFNFKNTPKVISLSKFINKLEINYSSISK